MIQRSYGLNGINREALDAALAETLGAAYGGFSAQERGAIITVTVFIASETKPAQITALDALMAAHDPAVLTDEQQARQAQQQKLAAARRDYKGTDLDPAAYLGETALVQDLARKIAWLEQEIAALHGD
jgi:hypothetical protein